MKFLSAIGWISFLLTVVGGLNWGLVGLFDLDLIRMVFGNMTSVSRFLYILVGFAAVYSLFFMFFKAI